LFLGEHHLNLRLLTLWGALVCVPFSLRAEGPTRLAVLEFETARDLQIDRTYFSDLARGAVHKGAPSVFVMTRESTEALLAANGKTMADCTGECEVEVGRKLGADFIVSGRITQVGSRLSLTMRLFSTSDGQLVESVEARGKSADDLLDHVDAAMEQLVAPLAKHGDEKKRAPPPKIVAVAPQPQPTGSFDISPVPRPAAPKVEAMPETKPEARAEPQREPRPEPKPAPVAALPPAPPSSTLEVQAPAPRPALKRYAPAMIVGGAVIGGASLAFDNLSSTSKDGRLTAVDFLPVAGYALALALIGTGLYQVATP
jgi:TolB-like protein